MSTGVKFTIGALCIAIAIGYLAILGATTSWQYYLSVDEAVIDAAELSGKRLRVSGRVGAGTLTISDDRHGATFDLCSGSHKLRVTCRCTIPDNIAENIDVVVEGVLEDDGIRCHKIITRCASKYEPEETESAASNTLAVTSETAHRDKSPSIR